MKGGSEIYLTTKDNSIYKGYFIRYNEAKDFLKMTFYNDPIGGVLLLPIKRVKRIYFKKEKTSLCIKNLKNV